MAAVCIPQPFVAMGSSTIVPASSYRSHSSDDEHAMSLVVDGDGDDAVHGHHDESGSHSGSADLTTSDDDAVDMSESLPAHITIAGITDQLRNLCKVMHDTIPNLQQNAVYEVSKWINYPVQVLVSDLHRPADDFGRYYMSTRSIGEFVLHILSANMTVKTNITTTIVRKFKAVNPDLSKYGLLVKTLGQKPEKSFLVQTIPMQSEQVSAAGKGRGSHQNSRGTSYYWPFWQIPRIVQPLIHTIRRSKAFRDIQYMPPGATPAPQTATPPTPVAALPMHVGASSGYKTPPRTPTRQNSELTKGSARKKCRSVSLSSDEGAPTVPAGLSSPLIVSANGRTKTTPRSKKQRDRSPENKPDIRVQLAPRMSSRRGRDDSDSDERSECEEEFLRNMRAPMVPASAPLSNASSMFAKSADATLFSIGAPATTTTTATTTRTPTPGMSALSVQMTMAAGAVHKRHPSGSEDSGLGSGPDDCRTAAALASSNTSTNVLWSESRQRDYMRADEIERSIEAKRAKIEEYNNILVGLLFEVAQEEQALKMLRGSLAS